MEEMTYPAPNHTREEIQLAMSLCRLQSWTRIMYINLSKMERSDRRGWPLVDTRIRIIHVGACMSELSEEPVDIRSILVMAFLLLGGGHERLDFLHMHV